MDQSNECKRKQNVALFFELLKRTRKMTDHCNNQIFFLFLLLLKMQQTNSVASQNRIGNLILSQEPIEDYNDFINHSLSEGGTYSIDIFKKQGFEAPQKQLTVASVIESHPHSPDSKQKMVSRNQLTSGSSKKETRYMYSRKVSQKNAFTNLMQYFHMKKFINRIIWKKKINSLFSIYHFNVISDKASSFNLKLFKENSIKFKMTPNLESLIRISMRKLGNWFKEVYARLDTIISKVPLFYPDARLKIIFDCLVLLARFYFMFVIPLDLSFSSSQIMYKDWFGITVVMIILMFADLFLSFNTAYYESGQIVTNRCKIAAYNISKSLGTELISVLLLLVFMAIYKTQDNYQMNVNTGSYQLVLLIFFVQFKNITKLIRMLEGALNLSKPTRSLLELFKLIAAFMFVLHVFACLWFWAGDYSHRHWQHSWLDAKSQIDVPWTQQYLYSFYFSTVTMFTVGFGDITPTTNLELLISIGFMMICSIQLSYSVSTVGAIIDQIFAYEDEKLKKLQTINSYMQNKNISFGLQFQIREYLNYFWSSQNEEDSSEEKLIIDQLSENLKEKLMVEANSQILNTCPLFKECFSNPLKKRLVKQFKQIVIQPESIINFDQLFPDQIGEVYICFVEQGQIEIFIENEANQLQFNQVSNEVSVVYNLKSGSSIGITSFITGKRSPERLRSVGFAKLLILSRGDFLKIIQDYPEDYEQFKHLLDNLVFNQNLNFLKMSCFSCGSMNHKALDCQMLHYVADREQIIKKIQFTRDQNRNEGMPPRDEKRQRSCFQPLLDHDVVKEGADFFQNEHWKWVQFYEDEEDSQKELANFQIKFDQEESPKDSIILEQEQTKRNKNTYLQRQKTRQYNSNLQVIQLNDPETNNLSIIQEEKPQQNKKVKKNVAFNDEQTGGVNKLKKKFQKAVKLVKQMNTFKKKKCTKSSSKLFLDQSTLQQDQIQRQNLMVTTLSYLQNKEKRISQQKKIKMHAYDRQMMEFLILKLQMLTKSSKYEVMDYLDTMKSYKFYFVHNNLEEILKKNQEFYVIQKQITPDLPNIFSKYVQYLMYPYEFIEKYKYVQLAEVADLQLDEKNLETEEQLNTIKDELKTFRGSRRKTTKKNIRKTQIRPLSEGALKKLA